ncbi:RagB/SusD family nutrient uptake outer membrane protein [Thalassobellus citreus]|uniref:RagB/SusD family nutrient uptake outer membrane protein n=1 Tax=Thalassobellus citreus TaxID=3367752 RepID=UPI00379A4D57
MKLKYILGIISMTLIVSCSKDFLQPESISTTDRNSIYSNIDDARKAVNAIYVSFSDGDGFRSRLSNNFTGNTDIEHQNGWEGQSGGRRPIWNLDATANNTDLIKMWTSAYQAINNSNNAISGIINSGNLEGENAAVYNQLLGEAHTMRAYWYSMLIYYFGDVPYPTEPTTPESNFFLSKTNRNEILSNEIQALINVEANMLWADEVDYGIEQINRDYTLGMIARLALQRGGYYLKPNLTMVRDSDYLEYYEIAKTYTKKLIDLKDRTLPTDFRQIFMNQCKYIVGNYSNSDILFEVPYASGEGDVGWNIGIDVEEVGATHQYGGGGNYMDMPETYYLSFDSEDKRRDVTCGLYEINTEGNPQFIDNNGISQGKWSRHFTPTPLGKESSKGTGINWPMMRYSDILLMYAEAENELNGPTADAQEKLKRVRQRAFDTPVDTYIASVSSSKEAFFDAIVDERAWEFGGEMIRKYELIRWGIYSDKMKETVEALKQLADDAIANTGTAPIKMYWKLDDSGNFIIANPDTRILAAPDDTWNEANFTSALLDDGAYHEWILNDWKNYYDGPQPGVARYIFPIPNTVIIESQGALQNDGYGFNQ